MSGKSKHGKGRYAYQAKVAVKKQGQRPMTVQDNTTMVATVVEKQPDIMNIGTRVVAVPDMSAAAPAIVKKIDLAFEMKKIGIITTAILVLLIILSVMIR